METLARRVHDDRPQTKYARNPPYGEDVKWLLNIAVKLGNYIYLFWQDLFLDLVFALLYHFFHFPR